MTSSIKFITAGPTPRLAARKSSMASFVCRAFLSVALLALSVMIHAHYNHSTATAGASTPRSCLSLTHEPMLFFNYSLEGRELTTENVQGWSDISVYYPTRAEEYGSLVRNRNEWKLQNTRINHKTWHIVWRSPFKFGMLTISIKMLDK